MNWQTRASALLFAMVAVSAAAWATGPTSAQEAPATLYVGTAAAPDYASPVLVVLNDGANFDSFSITLTFDPAFASLENADLAPDWAANGSVTAPDAGTIQLTGAAGSCTGAANCLLATLRFRPLETGDTEIAIASATLSAGGIFVPLVPSPGRLTTTAGAPEATAPAPVVAAPAARDDSLFAVSFVPAAVFVIALATAAAIGAVLVIAIGRRAWRWSSRPSSPTPAASFPDATVTPAFEGGVGDFLARVEAFGRVTGGGSRDGASAGLAVAASVAAVDSRPVAEALPSAASEERTT